MTPAAFRRAALAQAGAAEGAHHGHPDFRVGGKVFASLGPAGSGFGMVKLPPPAQAEFVRHAGFEAFAGAWGARGCTRVWLAEVESAAVSAALALAVADAGSSPVRGAKSGRAAPKTAKTRSARTTPKPAAVASPQSRSRKTK
jgi:hypothetical protein